MVLPWAQYRSISSAVSSASKVERLRCPECDSILIYYIQEAILVAALAQFLMLAE